MGCVRCVGECMAYYVTYLPPSPSSLPLTHTHTHTHTRTHRKVLLAPLQLQFLLHLNLLLLFLQATLLPPSPQPTWASVPPVLALLPSVIRALLPINTSSHSTHLETPPVPSPPHSHPKLLSTSRLRRVQIWTLHIVVGESIRLMITMTKYLLFDILSRD